jgi:protein-ribulosamine 3-kinase
MIPPDLQAAVEEKLSGIFSSHFSILKNQPVGGGCINHAHKLETNHVNFFLKWNDASAYPKMFEAEAKGLSELRSAKALYIPDVVLSGEANGKSFLILEWIEPGKRKNNFWNDFGEKLALIHQHTSTNFGLDHDNYIGSLNQSNRQHTSWTEFFIHERLEPQLKLAIDNNKLSNHQITHSSNLFNRLHEIIPEEKPSLLHGDLWNGNFMIGKDGSACLIDPAVYYGHREMDLAMTKLFGGFDSAFYQSYNETFPLEKNFETRIDIHNLYPLLVHVNLFGGGYIQQVNSILSRF